MARKALKIVGISLLGVAIAIGAYLGLLFYPGVLFAEHLRYKNFEVFSQTELPAEDVRRILDQVEGALLTSPINDPMISHTILFGHDNSAFAVIQDVACSISFRRSGCPVFTFNRAAPPHVSQVITFRVPDFRQDLLLHPQRGVAFGMSHDLTHEVVHTLVASRVGADRHISIPSWKREGYPEYVAASNRILADPSYNIGASVKRLLTQATPRLSDSSFLASANFGCGTQGLIQDETGNWRLACYYASRVLVEYLLDVRGLTFDELMSPAVFGPQAYRELIAAYESGEL